MGSSAQVSGLQFNSSSTDGLTVDPVSASEVAFVMIMSPMESGTISPSHSYTGQQRPGMVTLRQDWKKDVLGNSGHFSGLQSLSSSVVG